jgi:hypothetical protein
MHELMDSPLSKAPLSRWDCSCFLDLLSNTYLGVMSSPDAQSPIQSRSIALLVPTIPAVRMTCYCANYYVSSSFTFCLDVGSLATLGLDKLSQHRTKIR